MEASLPEIEQDRTRLYQEVADTDDFRQGRPPQPGSGRPAYPSSRGLEVAELAVRAAMTKLGCSLLEQLLELDTGYGGPRVDCGNGHQADFQGCREKIVDTVLGPVHLRRAYYACHQCRHGRFPIDEQLGVGDSSLGPGLRRIGARLGSQEAFGQGSRDLAELAGRHLIIRRE